MVEPDTIRLLRECDAGIKMGVSAIEDVVDRVADKRFRRSLTDCATEHDKLKAEIQALLDKYGDEGKNPNPIAQGMSHMKTGMKLGMDDSDQTIASLAVNFLFKGIGSHWTVELDGVAVEGDYSLVAVCNGRYYGGGFMPVAEARMDDGVLNTLVVKKVSRVTFAKFVGPYSRGEYAKFPAYAHCSTPKVIRIHSEKPDIVTCLDGECITGSDVTIRLCDKKLNFFGPEGCSCNATAR